MKSLQQFAYFLVILVFGALVLKEGAFILVPFVWGIFFAFALYPTSRWFERKEELSLIFGEDWMNSTQQVQLWDLFTTENVNQTLLETGRSITLIGIIPLYTFLLLYYKDFFTEFLVRYSSKNQAAVLHWVNDSGKVIQSYLVGMIRMTGIVALLSGIYFYTIGLEYFILFAAFIAIMNLIPYVGVFISSVFVILYVFLTTDSVMYPLLTFVTLWGIQLLENNLITPIIVGSKVKVNALAVIFAILLGGWLWGISGMVLFIPVVGVIKITLERSEKLQAFGYLLSDDVPISEDQENFWKIIQKALFQKEKK